MFMAKGMINDLMLLASGFNNRYSKFIKFTYI